MSSLLFGWGSVLATHGWYILDLSASSLGSTGAPQRGYRAERGQSEGSLVPQVDHCLWLDAGGCLSHIRQTWPKVTAPIPSPFSLLPWPSQHLP